MKTFKVIAAVMLAVSMLTTSVFAAEFVPSIEYKEEPEIERVEKEYETPGRTLKIIPYSSIYLQDVIFEADALNVSVEAAEEMEETVRDRLAESGEELKKEMLRNVIVGFEEAWTQMTDGAPLENAIIHDIFEITLICSQIEDFVTNEWIKM